MEIDCIYVLSVYRRLRAPGGFVEVGLLDLVSSSKSDPFTVGFDTLWLDLTNSGSLPPIGAHQSKVCVQIRLARPGSPSQCFDQQGFGVVKVSLFVLVPDLDVTSM